MEINGLKLIGSAVIVSGLLAGTFFAGSLTTGTSADPVPTPAYTVQEDPIATPTPVSKDPGGVPDYEVKEDEPQQLSQTTQEQQPQQPVEEQKPAESASPVVGTPVSVTPVPSAPAPEPQNDAPYVLSGLPADSAIGVAVDANIVLHFSESMDKASVQAAFNLSTGNCGVFAWNGDATQMTFNPCNDWAYGTVVNVELQDSAADALGLGMEDDFESSFRVLRKITTKIYGNAELDGHVYYGGYVSPNAQPIIVSRQARGFVSFDLSELPQDLVKIESASVHVRQWDSMIGAYGPKTGNLMIQSVSYGVLDSSDFYMEAHDLCAVICLGGGNTDTRLLSDNPLDGWKSTDMSLAVRMDWNDRENRDNLSQFRLRFEHECHSDQPACADAMGVSMYSASTTYRPFLMVTLIAP
jgi:Bacterial Ig-like domain